MQQPPVPEAPDESIKLGFKYPEGGVFVPNDNYTAFKDACDDPTCPSAVPGSRFPHSSIQEAGGSGNPISTIDLVERNFLLITIDADSPWTRVASQSPVTLDVYTLNATSSPYKDPAGDVERKCCLKRGEAILVRPDDFIAWRGARAEYGHEQRLRDALAAMLEK
jgi:hypothetical protein